MALPSYDPKRRAMPVLDHRNSAGSWAAPTSRPEDVFDPNEDLSAQLTGPERARTIIGNNRTGTISLCVGEPAAPIGFVTNYTVDADGSPAFVLREGVVRMSRPQDGCPASFSVAETPLTASNTAVAGGVTVLGTLRIPTPAEMQELVMQHAKVHSGDAKVVGRGEADLFVIELMGVVLTGNESELERISVREYRAASADPLAAVAPGLLTHLRGDQNGSLVLLCRAFGGQPTASAAQLIGIDRYGMDLMATISGGREPVRLGFSHPVSSPEEVRKELTTLVRAARFKLGVG